MKADRFLFLALIVCHPAFLATWAGEKSLPVSQPEKISSAQTNANSLPSPVPIPPGPFDLQTCYELAVLRSETLGMKEEDIRVAEARYWQTVGTILPKIHSATQETWQNKRSGGFGVGGSVFRGGGGGASGGSVGNRQNFFETQLNVKQPIFSGFREFNIGAAGKAEVAARKHDRKRGYQLLYLDVSDVFHQILAYEGDLKILEEVQTTLKQRVAEIERRAKLGRSREGEVLMARVDLADAGVTVEQVRGLLGASRELMGFLTGVPSQALKLQEGRPLPKVEALEAYLVQSGERPDVLSAMEEDRAARRKLSAAQGEHWPTISAEGNYYLKENPDFGREWEVFLRADIPLFEGGAIEARVSEQKALVRTSELNLAMLRRSVQKDIRTAYNNFISSIARVARAKEASEAAEENYRVQARDYKRGVVSNLDVLQALKQQFDLKRRLWDAEMDARSELIRLHVAAGRETP